MSNIVICADGTWNRPEEDLATDHPSNVLKLARGISLGDAANRQHVFYDWGLGSYHNQTSAGIAGRGIHKNILDGYRYVVHNYAPGRPHLPVRLQPRRLHRPRALRTDQQLRHHQACRRPTHRPSLANLQEPGTGAPSQR